MNTIKQKLQLIRKKMNPCFEKIARLRARLPKRKPHSERYYKTIHFLNKYSLVFHFLLACLITFVVEVISRRDVISTFSFLHNHTLAYLYNAFIVFASLSGIFGHIDNSDSSMSKNFFIYGHRERIFLYMSKIYFEIPCKTPFLHFGVIFLDIDTISFLHMSKLSK